jgi:hypothetical protein
LLRLWPWLSPDVKIQKDQKKILDRNGRELNGRLAFTMMGEAMRVYGAKTVEIEPTVARTLPANDKTSKT